MSTLEDLDEMERDEKEQKDRDDKEKKPSANGGGKDADMKDADTEKKGSDDYIDMEILTSSTRDIFNRRQLLENEMKILKSEFKRLTHEQNTMKEKIKDNNDKIENNRLVTVTSLYQPCRLLIRRSDSSLTWSEMLSNCWISMLKPRRRKREPTLILTQPAWANLPLSKHPPDRPSSCRSLVLSTTPNSNPVISLV